MRPGDLAQDDVVHICRINNVRKRDWATLYVSRKADGYDCSYQTHNNLLFNNAVDDLSLTMF